MTSTKQRKNRKRASTALGPVPQIIARIPHPYPESPQAFSDLITKELVDIWRSILSEAERHDFPQQVSATSFEKLDALILKQAETFGWRLALSQPVQSRFENWDFDPMGPTLFAQYGKAVAKAARRFQGREPPPIDDPQLYQVKRETVLEIREVLKNLRGSFSKGGVRPSSDELVEHFQKIVSAKTEQFGYLNANINSWVRFFRTDSITIKLLLNAKRTSPAALFDAWYAGCKGLEPETDRQKISELRDCA